MEKARQAVGRHALQRCRQALHNVQDRCWDAHQGRSLYGHVKVAGWGGSGAHGEQKALGGAAMADQGHGAATARRLHHRAATCRRRRCLALTGRLIARGPACRRS